MTIEQHRGSSLALDGAQEFWTDRQIAGLRQLGVDRASNGDLAVFMHVCQRTGLDPFARQIYMIERQGKQTIQTGIDGFRLVARRAVDRRGETLGIGAGEWCGQSGRWRDVWLSEEPPAAARVVVTRNGSEFVGLALYSEYVQRKRDGDPNSQWTQRPAHMLAKCAEALALRKAFPQDLSGIYTDDELAAESRPQVRAQRGGLAAALEDEPQTTGAGVNVTESVPLTAEDEAKEVDHAAATADAGHVFSPADLPAPAPDPTADARPVTKAQLRMLFASLSGLEVADEDRHRVVSAVLGRAVESFSDLTGVDASTVIDRLATFGTPTALLAWLTHEPAYDPTTGEVFDAEVVE